MGLDKYRIDFIEQALKKYVGKKLNEIKMLELGNQILWGGQVAKEYYSNLNVEHVSIDLNGLNGALKKDLTIPEQFAEFNNKFDIVTNSGTTEHIEPTEKQLECFKIIHDCLMMQGISIHFVPDETERNGKWIRHCKKFYSVNFFEMLAKESNSELLECFIGKDKLRWAVLRKTTEKFECSPEKFIGEIS